MATKQMSILLPQPLYQRVQQLARIHQQSLDAVLETAVVLAETQWPMNTADEEDMAQEEAAYQAMHPELMQRYAGQYVAIWHGELVGHDPDELTLLRRIEAEYGDEVVLLKQVRPLPEPVLRLRSPRLFAPVL